MIKYIFFLFLFSAGLFSPLEAIASGGYTLTHTTPALELKPISSIDNSYQTASVCFLGVGDCDPNIGHSTGDDDMDTDEAKQCQNSGFTKATCNAAQDPIKKCGHDTNFVTGCECKKNLLNCPRGQVGSGPSCDGKYVSCQCDPSLLTCDAPKFGEGATCDGRHEKCTCPASVSMSQSNDRCTQTCDGKCIAKTCDETADEQNCSYDTESCSDGCGGNTRRCCKEAPPCDSSHPNWCPSDQTCHGDCCSDGTHDSCDTRCGGSGCYTPSPEPEPEPEPEPDPEPATPESSGPERGRVYLDFQCNPGCGDGGSVAGRYWIITEDAEQSCECSSGSQSMGRVSGYGVSSTQYPDYTSCENGIKAGDYYCNRNMYSGGGCDC